MGELDEVEVLLPHRSGAVPGVDQQIVNEPRHALGRSTNHLANRPEFVFIGIGVRHDNIEVGADHSERVTQLVAGLVDELTLVLKGMVEAAKHVVERVGELFEFVIRAFEFDTARQIRAGNLLSNQGDPSDWSQHEAGNEPADAEAADEQQTKRAKRIRPKLVECLLIHFTLEHRELVDELDLDGNADDRAVLLGLKEPHHFLGAADVLVAQLLGKAGVDTADDHRGKAEKQDRVEHHQPETNRPGPAWEPFRSSDSDRGCGRFSHDHQRRVGPGGSPVR